LTVRETDVREMDVREIWVYLTRNERQHWWDLKQFERSMVFEES